MRIAIVGGRLQGLEAVYLAKKAGMQVVLIDKNENIPARNLADIFHCLNALDTEKLTLALKDVEVVVPALENKEVLDHLKKITELLAVPFAYDQAAYELSASKSRSDQLFLELDIPAPAYYPHCKFPLLAKPSEASGSEGVVCLANRYELEELFKKENIEPGSWIIQEYLEGPSYSLEIIGYNGEYLPLQVTDLQMDADYDCKRVLAPSELTAVQQSQFALISEKIAAALNLKGIMDVEVILHEEQLKVLEIDARLPSQTPTAVYHSSGVNILDLLVKAFALQKLPESPVLKKEKFAIFEHVKISDSTLEVCGEHIVSVAGPLSHKYNFFGADEALTNYSPGSENWMATLIITGNDREDAFNKRDKVISGIMEEHKISEYLDPIPIAQFPKLQKGAGN